MVVLYFFPSVFSFVQIQCTRCFSLFTCGIVLIKECIYLPIYPFPCFKVENKIIYSLIFHLFVACLYSFCLSMQIKAKCSTIKCVEFISVSIIPLFLTFVIFLFQWLLIPTTLYEFRNSAAKLANHSISIIKVSLHCSSELRSPKVVSPKRNKPSRKEYKTGWISVPTERQKWDVKDRNLILGGGCYAYHCHKSPQGIFPRAQTNKH